jgi:hypothetical protein
MFSMAFGTIAFELIGWKNSAGWHVSRKASIHPRPSMRSWVKGARLENIVRSINSDQPSALSSGKSLTDFELLS